MHFDCDECVAGLATGIDGRSNGHWFCVWVVKEIFGGYDLSLPQGNRQQAASTLSLKLLDPSGFDFSQAANVVLDHLQLERLPSLSLRHCEHVDKFVGRFIQSSRDGKMKLQELVIINNHASLHTFRFP